MKGLFGELIPLADHPVRGGGGGQLPGSTSAGGGERLWIDRTEELSPRDRRT